jgi:parvulin-like peptidyl-prolyl isomerase
MHQCTRPGQIIIYFATYLIISLITIHAQNKDDIIARSGDFLITFEEFQHRFEFTPHPQRADTNIMDVKKEFLLTLIAEKLLAGEAISRGLNNSDDMIGMMNYLRDIYLRDALYQIEVKDKITLPDSLLHEGLNRIRKKYQIKFIFSDSKIEIDSIFGLLVNGVDFDSLLNERIESIEQSEIKLVSFGDTHPLIEETIYKLLPGMITNPIELKEGWYICKIYDVTSKEIVDSQDESKIRTIVSSRIEDAVYQEFYKKFFTGKQVNADGEVFNLLANSIHFYLTKNEKLFSKNSRSKFSLGESEINELKNFLEKDLSRIFIKFETDPVDLNQFLFDLIYGGINFNSTELTHVVSVLNTRVRTYIQNQLLSREALKRELDKIPPVANELKRWNDYYLSHLLMKQFYLNSAVTDSEALDFYNKENQVIQLPDTVKVAQMITNNLSIIEEVLNRISRGEKFVDLCKEYDSRNLLDSDKYISNYFPVTERGEIGKVSEKLEINETYGPFQFGNNYALIQLLDKKIGKKQKIALFKEAKENIKSILRTKKMYGSLDTLVSTIASEENLEINFERLTHLKVTDVNMMVLKRFGFGGQLLAVPFSSPYASWYELFIKKLQSKLP